MTDRTPGTPRPGTSSKPPPPVWRRSYNEVEKRVAGPLTGAVRSELFADTVAAVTRIRGAYYRFVERSTRRALHLWNLPAATDVRRLQEQVAVLQRQIAGQSARCAAERAVRADTDGEA